MKCELALNGQSVADFKSFTEKERELAKEVKLMGKTGYASVTPRFQAEVDYVIPQTAAVNWEGVTPGGTLTVTLDGGGIIRLTGVTVLKIGDMKIDGENETTRTITLGATGRSEE
jgi:hypothetical protein